MYRCPTNRYVFNYWKLLCRPLNDLLLHSFGLALPHQQRHVKLPSSPEFPGSKSCYNTSGINEWFDPTPSFNIPLQDLQDLLSHLVIVLNLYCHRWPYTTKIWWCTSLWSTTPAAWAYDLPRDLQNSVYLTFWCFASIALSMGRLWTTKLYFSSGWLGWLGLTTGFTSVSGCSFSRFSLDGDPTVNYSDMIF